MNYRYSSASILFPLFCFIELKKLTYYIFFVRIEELWKTAQEYVERFNSHLCPQIPLQPRYHNGC